jgi:hypothetical protein
MVIHPLPFVHNFSLRHGYMSGWTPNAVNPRLVKKAANSFRLVFSFCIPDGSAGLPLL